MVRNIFVLIKLLIIQIGENRVITLKVFRLKEF